MKTKFFNPKIEARSKRGQAGLTLIEILMAVAITALTVAGIVKGYQFCLILSAKNSLYMAAIERAQERLEQARNARWVIGPPTIDELVPSNFPPETVVLDLFAQSTNSLTAVLTTTITNISTSPPLRSIHVDCVWQFQGTEGVVNSIETCRAPDQ